MTPGTPGRVAERASEGPRRPEDRRGPAREATASLTDETRRNFVVIVPAYNEAPVIPDLVQELRRAFQDYALDGEVLLVDDGSDDGTGDLAEREAESWEAFRVLRHRTNRGKTEALVTAARATDREFVVLFDADLQHLPEEIPRFLSRLQEGWDIVTGRKVGGYSKQVVSSVYNWLSQKIFDVPVSDLNSMKAFRRSILDDFPLRHDWHRFFVVLAHSKGYSVTEIDIPLFPRRGGTSKYTGSFRIVVGLMDLLSVWFLLLFSRKPLLLFGFTGLALLAAGIVVGGAALYLRFVHQMGFRPLLDLVLLLVTVGVVLLGFGLVAEMIAQLRDEVDQLMRESDSGSPEG